VANSFLQDSLQVPIDVYKWWRNRQWPSKLSLLRAMQVNYPHVFAQEDEEVLVCITREDFRNLVVQASRRKAMPADGDAIFEHYCHMTVLLIAKENSGMHSGELGSQVESNVDSEVLERKVQSLLSHRSGNSRAHTRFGPRSFRRNRSNRPNILGF